MFKKYIAYHIFVVYLFCRERGEMSAGSLQKHFQSKASILKRDDGMVTKSKKVHFARSQLASSPLLPGLKSRPHEMDASMVSKSWSTSKASRRRQHVKESSESDSGVSHIAAQESEPVEFEVESILGHKVKVGLNLSSKSVAAHAPSPFYGEVLTLY